MQPNLGGLKPKEPEPNPFDTQTEDLTKAVEAAKDVLVLIRDNPKLDHVASALSLYLALKASGKSVTVASSTQMRVEFNRLVAVNKITTSIGNRNLIVSFPYVKDSIEKVSYNVDESRFNLVVQPKPGFPSLESDKVEYSYSGAEADLVFVVGAQKLEDLGVLYQAERNLFDKATIVNIDAAPTNTKFGQINLVWSEFSSASEVVVQIIEKLEFKLDQDMATNLLAGLNEATQNFQRFNVKASAFEVAAKLMQAGGKKPMGASPFGRVPGGPLGSPLGMMPRSPFPPSPAEFPQTPSPQPTMRPAAPAPAAPTHQPSPVPSGQVPVGNLTGTGPKPIAAVQSPSLANTKVTEPKLPEPATQTSQPLAQPSPAPADTGQPQQNTSGKDDWLKPKIYKGSSKV